MLFTYGENLGSPDCPVPLGPFDWKKTRPPVVMDVLGRARRSGGARTSPPSPRSANKGKDVTWQGETYQWSKHSNFLRFLDLPRRTPQPLPDGDEAGAARRSRRRCGRRAGT